MVDFFLNGFSTLGTGLVGYGVPFLFVLTIVVFFHELGHFLVARWAGVKVLTFSIGFGPELIGFNDRHGTRWKLVGHPARRLCASSSAMKARRARRRRRRSRRCRRRTARSASTTRASPARAAIVAAGPIANFLLAIVIFAGLFTILRQAQCQRAMVDTVEAGSAAAAAGFRAGDIVTAIDGTTIERFSDMQRIVSTRAGQELAISVKRGDSNIVLRATPELREIKDDFGNTHEIGVLGIKSVGKAGGATIEKVDPITALGLGAKQTWYRRRADVPVTSAKCSAGQARRPTRSAARSESPRFRGRLRAMGLDYLMNLTAVLSVSIGLLNLFPVPLLDGGHLMYLSRRGRSGTAAVRACQGNGLPGRVWRWS